MALAIGETRPMDGVFITPLDPAPDGTRLAVKDLFDTARIRTTYGSAIFADHVPERTAEAVRLLVEAGYANVGKTNLHEFAYGTTSVNPHYGTVPNPLAPGRIAGGSSGGSAAALAAGLADAALGSDSGGSIRIPAACCGIVGFKPSYALVSLAGCFPLAPSFDHAGPMARNVVGCVELLRALAPGFEPMEPRPLRAGLFGLGEADPLVRARVEEAAARFPGLRRIEFPDVERSGPAFMREVAEVHRELYEEQPEAYGEDVARKLERCFAVTDAEYARAVAEREAYRDVASAALGDLDLLLAPTLPMVAPTVEESDGDRLRERILTFTYRFNALGWPALALPCGAAEDGLPASIQLVGRPGADALVLAAGAWLEAQLAAERTAAS
jgi:aspartyl-tRNA(Asn)/glutamyl-tRNA(Gln) amidotransferase subunit A